MKVFLLVICFASVLSAADLPAGACKTNDEEFNTEEGGCLQLREGAVWGLPPLRTFGYREASAYCESLKDAGFSDWRLPQLSEIARLAKSGLAPQAFEFNALDYFWIAATHSHEDGWTIELGSGERKQSNLNSDKARALCVRTPSDLDRDGIPDSSDQCNLTIRPGREKATVWRKGPYKGCASGETYATVGRAKPSWTSPCRIESERFMTGRSGCVDVNSGLEWSMPIRTRDDLANQFCTSLNDNTTESGKDWRLPSVSELIDISGAEFGPRHFSFAVETPFLSSTVETSRHTLVPSGTPHATVDLITGARGIFHVQLANAPFHRSTSILCVRPSAWYQTLKRK